MDALRILIVEDRQEEAALLTAKINRAVVAHGPAVTLEVVGSLLDARARLREGDFDVILLDLGLPDSVGRVTMEAIFDAADGVPILVHSGHQTRSVALDCLRFGADDFISKNDQSGEDILRAILFALIRRARQAGTEEQTVAVAKRLASFI